jgi:hypothetical protein
MYLVCSLTSDKLTRNITYKRAKELALRLCSGCVEGHGIELHNNGFLLGIYDNKGKFFMWDAEKLSYRE